MQKSSSEFQGGEAVIVVCNNTRVILRNLAELGLQLQELASFTTTYTTWNYIFLAGISSRNNLFFCTNRRDGPEIDQFRPCHPPCQKHNMAPCGESTTHIYGCPTSYHWLLLPPFSESYDVFFFDANIYELRKSGDWKSTASLVPWVWDPESGGDSWKWLIHGGSKACHKICTESWIGRTSSSENLLIKSK